jgi:hypothetical protein
MCKQWDDYNVDYGYGTPDRRAFLKVTGVAAADALVFPAIFRAHTIHL